jgi:hypothetical protein
LTDCVPGKSIEDCAGLCRGRPDCDMFMEKGEFILQDDACCQLFVAKKYTRRYEYCFKNYRYPTFMKRERILPYQ